MVNKRQPEALPPTQEVRFAHPDGPSVHVQTIRLSELRGREMSHSIYGQSRLDFHLMQIVLEGDGAHCVDFEMLPLRKGDVLLIRPEQVHAFDEASTHEALLVIFLPEALAEPLPRDFVWRRENVLHPTGEDFSLLVDLATSLGELPRRGEVIRTVDLGKHLLGALVTATKHLVEERRTTDPARLPGSADLMERFDGLLERHLLTQHGVAWYADQLGVSTRTLARACDATVGTKPKRHIDLRLGLEAKRRLIFSPVTVEDLSGYLGFSEPTNFVKFFRRVVGQTPSEFRREMLGDGA